MFKKPASHKAVEKEQEQHHVLEAQRVDFTCCPFGYRAAVPLVFGYWAAIFASASIFSCYVVGNPYVLFGYDCLRFVPASAYDYEDTPFRYGRIASALGGLGGLVYTGIVTSLLSCKELSQRSLSMMGACFVLWGVLSLSAVVAVTTEACDFMDENEPTMCSSGPGMGLSLTAGLFFLLPGVSTCFLEKLHLGRFVYQP